MPSRASWAASRSLRWRVTALAVVVVAVSLVVIGLAVDLTLSAQLRRDQQGLLGDRLARATVLVSAGTPTSEVLAQVRGQGIRAAVVDPSGRRLLPVAADEPDPDGPRQGPRGGFGPPPDGPPRDRGRAPTDPVRVLVLPDGNRLVLTVDPDENAGVLRRLRVVLVTVGAAGLVVTALVLLGGVRVALRPLEQMTAVARGIAAGDRGRRLRPERSDTELGRTARAFDDMLDALEAAQGRAEDAAAEARRSEATTRQFLSDAAHELRTPITGVQSLAETLVRDPDGELARRERIATTLVRETRRAGALVADMLELARIEGGQELQRREVDLRALAAAEGERVALLAPSLHVEAPDGPPVTAWVDPGRVTQILANLLDNARRHSPPGGTVRLAVAGDDDAGATVTVSDEGTGVPEADRERVFDRLVRLDDARARDTEGTVGAGLGLAIARALARAHGGDLVCLPVTTGASFRLTLPRRDTGTPA